MGQQLAEHKPNIPPEVGAPKAKQKVVCRLSGHHLQGELLALDMLWFVLTKKLESTANVRKACNWPTAGQHTSHRMTTADGE